MYLLSIIYTDEQEQLPGNVDSRASFLKQYGKFHRS